MFPVRNLTVFSDNIKIPTDQYYIHQISSQGFKGVGGSAGTRGRGCLVPRNEREKKYSVLVVNSIELRSGDVEKIGQCAW